MATCVREQWLVVSANEFELRAIHLPGEEKRVADWLSPWHLAGYLLKWSRAWVSDSWAGRVGANLVSEILGAKAWERKGGVYISCSTLIRQTDKQAWVKGRGEEKEYARCGGSQESL